MRPLTKFHSLILSITTLGVFTIWTQLIKLMELNELFKILLGALISLGLYRIFLELLLSLSRKSRSIKEFILGPHYLEGTWIGFYIGAEGNVRYMVEKFEQEIDSLVIRGQYYNEILNHHSMMTTERVNIDAKKGELSYVYTCHPIKEQSPQEGFAIFNFHRQNQYSPPNQLIGYSAELYIGKRIKTYLSKSSNRTDINLNEALAVARTFYEKNKEIF